MNILKYNNFILEKNFSESGNYKIYYSNSFKNLIKKIMDIFDESPDEWKISKYLLSIEDQGSVVDKTTLIDITDKNDTISFIQGNRILRKEPELIGDYLPWSITKDEDNEFWKTGRTNIFIGRWVKKIITITNSSYTDSQIEKFVNAYKYTFNLINNLDELLDVVQGEEIRKFYNEKNYARKAGQLVSSCMRQEVKGKFLDIYIKNPEVCKLLILRDSKDSNKILGRSLLWTLKDGRYYQDRIYTANDSDVFLFKKWANDNGYLNYSSEFDTISVQLGNHDYDYYPYMDTFLVYNPQKNILSNDEDLWPGQGYIKILEVDGTYLSDNVVYSEYHNDWINLENAVECNNGVGTEWLYSDEAHWIEYLDEWWSPYCGYIVESSFHGKKFHIDYVVYVDAIDDWIYPGADNVIEVIENSKGDIIYLPVERDDLYVRVGDVELDNTDKCLYKPNIIKDPYTGEIKFKDSKIDGKGYDIYIADKIREELGEIKNFSEHLSNIYRDFNYEGIEELVRKNNYWKLIWNVYWGLSKQYKPEEKDMVSLLFASILMPEIHNSAYLIYLKRIDPDVYEKFKAWKIDSRLINRVQKFIDTFDFSDLGLEVYKIWLWFRI
jgi:hypothetical protein